jgi:hypothetical protein
MILEVAKEKACSQHTQPEGYDTPQKNAHSHTPVGVSVARGYCVKCRNSWLPLPLH